MIKHKCIILLYLLIFLPVAAFSTEVINPLQIFFVGNIQGNLVELNKDLKLSPGLSWRVPNMISLLSNESLDTVVYSCGDISSIYNPISFLFEGKIERDFIEKCSPCGSSISPNDMMVLNTSHPDRRAFKCIFSNVEGEDFPSRFLTNLNYKTSYSNITFYNFISPSRCRQLLLDKWSHVKVNQFSRAFRMLNIKTGKKDVTVSTVYGSKDEVEELAKLFSRKEGIHFLLQMPEYGKEADYPYTDPMKAGNVYKFSIENGCKKLPMLKITFKNSGYPRASLRMLPLDKWEKGNSDELYEEAEKEIRNEIFKPLRVISTEEKASTSTNYLSKESHAFIIKNNIRCDVAFVLDMSQEHFSENVINVGNIITTVDNDRIYKLRLTGKELRDSILKLFDEYGSQELVFAGCSFKYFAGEIKDLRIGMAPVRDKSVYIVAVPESTIKKSQTLSDVYNKLLPDFEGVYLWNLWKSCLKTSKMTNSELFE